MVEVGGGPIPRVTKRATTPASIGRLRAEAAMLTAARHPGVVALVDVEQVHDEAGAIAELRMHTAVAGSRTLASLGDVPLDRAAGLIAALAATVADLHHMGLVHGRITADHVLIAADGRPVLCGFAGARHADSDDGPRRTDDVAAMGVLLRDLVLQTDAVLEEAPSGMHRWKRGGARLARGPLLNLADQATADEPGHRPSAEQLAAAIGATVPEATLREASTPSPSRDADSTHVGPGPAARPRQRILIGSLVAALAVAALAAMTWDRSGADSPANQSASTATDPEGSATGPASPEPVSPYDTASNSTEPNSTAPSSAPTEAPIEAARGCATGEGAGTVATGEPCAVPLLFERGAIVIGEARYDVGLDAAAAAIGDFECQGEVRAAVVDLSTGDVYIFDGWATATRSRQAEAVDTIASPRRLIAETDPGGCHRLVVLDQWGLRHLIAPTSEDMP